MNQIWQGVITVAVAIIGVATLAVIVSRNSNTGAVVTDAGNAFAHALGAALSPITGSTGELTAPQSFGSLM